MIGLCGRVGRESDTHLGSSARRRAVASWVCEERRGRFREEPALLWQLCCRSSARSIGPRDAGSRCRAAPTAWRHRSLSAARQTRRLFIKWLRMVGAPNDSKAGNANFVGLRSHDSCCCCCCCCRHPSLSGAACLVAVSPCVHRQRPPPAVYRALLVQLEFRRRRRLLLWSGRRELTSSSCPNRQALSREPSAGLHASVRHFRNSP